MQRHTASMSNYRVFAAILCACGATLCAWADAIQFSKPAVEIATPQKAPDLPEPESKIDFGSAPAIERPLVMPSPAMRPPPHRERENEDDDADRHPLLRRPKGFSESPDRSDSRDSRSSAKNLSTKNVPATAWNRTGNKSSEGQNALSPITDPNWDPRDQESQRQNESNSKNRSEARDRTDARARELYGKREEETEQRSPFEAPPVPDPFSSHPREKLTAAERIERRAAFEELFNPGAPVARPTGSLEPVTGLEAIKAPVPTAMPTLAGPKRGLSPAQPPNLLAPQAQLRGPLPEDFGRKFAPQNKPAAASPTDSRFQTSLMRQPTVHEIPSRKGL